MYFLKPNSEETSYARVWKRQCLCLFNVVFGSSSQLGKDNAELPRCTGRKVSLQISRLLYGLSKANTYETEQPIYGWQANREREER